MADNAQLDSIIDMLEIDSKRMHDIVNGSATQQVTVEDGSLIPTVRKALVDNLFFKTPPLAWVVGSRATVFNQLYTFTAADGAVTWWYAPSATASKPVVLPTDPSQVSAWRLYFDYNYLYGIFAPIISPVLKGTPQAPTADITTNSDQIATTAFVNNLFLSNTLSSTFKNITVSVLTKTKDLTVTGDTLITGKISGVTSLAEFNKIHLFGEDALLDFEYRDPDNINGIPTKVSPYTVESDNLVSTNLNSNVATIENGVIGVVDADIVNVGDLNISGTVTGLNIESNVDGMNIKPETVETNNLTVTNNASVGNQLTVKDSTSTGTTTVNDLIITGNVLGLDFSVDGLDIRPNSVYTTENLVVGTQLTVADNSNLNNIILSGTISPLKNDPEDEEAPVLPEYVVIDGGVLANLSIDTAIGGSAYIKEQGVRVYSPNNKPTPADLGTYTSTEINDLINEAGGFVDAPIDGKIYGRKDAAWEEVTSGGGGTGSVTSVDGVSPDGTGNVALGAGKLAAANTWQAVNTFANGLSIVAGGISAPNNSVNAKYLAAELNISVGGTQVISKVLENSTYYTQLGSASNTARILSSADPLVSIAGNPYKIYHEGNSTNLAKLTGASSQFFTNTNFFDGPTQLRGNTVIRFPKVYNYGYTGVAKGAMLGFEAFTGEPQGNGMGNIIACENKTMYFRNVTGIDSGTNAYIYGEQMSFSPDGLLTVKSITTTNNITALDVIIVSDIRNKRNINKITNGLEVINSLNGYTYDVFAEDEQESQSSAGVIAQELEKVAPELVETYQNSKGEDRLRIKPNGLTAYLIEANKELTIKYNDLEAKYESLMKLVEEKLK